MATATAVHYTARYENRPHTNPQHRVFTTNRPFKEGYVHPSRVSYQALADNIVADRSSKVDKVRAIYAWVCKNIDYDTTYSIYHADECYAARRGVCQAYCELFYHIAKCVGIRTRIVTGKSKDRYGVIGEKGHAWLYVDLDGKGMLLDPTWGAGGVNGNIFTRDSNTMWCWYDVDPKLMVRSHLPENEEDQFLDTPITASQFATMHPATAEWALYKLDIDRFFTLARSNRLEMPKLYPGRDGAIVELLDIPLHRTLRVGRCYTFRIKLKDSRYNIYIVNYRTHTDLSEWQYEGDGIYYINYTLRDSDDLRIVYGREGQKERNVLIDYSAVTEDDRRRQNQDNPLYQPEMSSVANLYAKEWEDAGVDGHTLARHIKDQHIEALPIIYTTYGVTLRIVDIPMHHRLRKGVTYTFSFYPRTTGKWAIVENKIKWHRDFEHSPDGRLTIHITPQLSGMLILTLNENEDKFYGVIGYEVEP